jgi:hypothetical protein
LSDLIVSKSHEKKYFSEKVLVDFALQLLSAIEYCQDKNYSHSPGAINQHSIYFTQMCDMILLDISNNLTSFSSSWVEENFQQLLNNCK